MVAQNAHLCATGIRRGLKTPLNLPQVKHGGRRKLQMAGKELQTPARGRGRWGRGLRETGLRRPSSRGRRIGRGLGRRVAAVAGEGGLRGRGVGVEWAEPGQGFKLRLQSWNWRDQSQFPASWILERFGECWLLSPLPGAARLPGAGVSAAASRRWWGGGERAIWAEDPLLLSGLFRRALKIREAGNPAGGPIPSWSPDPGGRVSPGEQSP